MPDKAILKELGQRIARYRLNLNMTQDALAIEAGASKPTIQRIEHGKSSQVTNLIRILRALGLLENLNALIPEPDLNPMQQVKMQGKIRRRVSSITKQNPPSAWHWEEDE